MDRYSPVYQITRICHKIRQERKKKIISYKFGMATKGGQKRKHYFTCKKRRIMMGKESDVVFITVCKQNKYFLDYTARRQKKKKKTGP